MDPERSAEMSDSIRWDPWPCRIRSAIRGAIKRKAAQTESAEENVR